MTYKLKLLVCCLWMLVILSYLSQSSFLAFTTKADAATQQGIDFQRDIQPIFEAACYKCHGGEKAKAGLRLDDKTAALKGGNSGQVIVAGHSKDSLLMQRVMGQGGGMRMPPGGELSKEQISLLAAWIDEGAQWPESTTSAQKGSNAHATIDFVKDVQPIFKSSCYACHSGSQPKAQLKLDAKTLAMKGGVSGPAIIPGDSDKSRLIHRVMGLHDEPRMPLKGAPLTPEQITILKRWIDEGAQWPESAAGDEAKLQKHWAFIKPERPNIPTVTHTSWPRNPIDNFILARLERESLQPSPEADKETLLRRVTYDLTGLPPTPAEIDSFLADTAPDAYERRVDKLLQSPHYGERMAMQWLDLARYSDTHGYHIDSHRDMWPWRDWLIKTFNQNMPFDQFTIQQLAGDLLPDATTEQKIASGFNRNHMINFEGGAIPEEYQVEYVIDRVETTSNVWLGMTMGCARCHNHKYDPITQKEFYQFSAFFNNVAEKGLDGRTGNAEPFLQLPTPEQKAQQDQIKAAIKEHETALSPKVVMPLQEAWEKNFVSHPVVSATTRDGLLAHYEMDGSLIDLSGHYRNGRTISGDPTFGAGQVGRAITFDGESEIGFPGVGDFNRTDAFSLALWFKGSSNMPITLLDKLSDEKTRQGYEIYFDDLQLIGIQRRAARVNVKLTAHWPDSSLDVRTKTRLSLDNWHHLTLTCDGSGKAAGVKIYENGKPVELEVIKDTLGDASIKTSAELQIGNKEFGKAYKGQLDDLRFYNRVLNDDEIQEIALHDPARQIVSGVDGKRSKDESKFLRDYYLTYAAPDSLRQLYKELKSLRKQREKLEAQITTVMVMKELGTGEKTETSESLDNDKPPEMEKPRETFVLARGDYRNKTEKVSAGVPAVLPSLPKNETVNRLTLAKWLVDPNHPLTARVAVNRYWQMYFGFGIVKTSEDFGTQGERPVHPELLDWLATEFIRTKWDIRAMQRLIVTSATYRQSSVVTPALHEKDPENRLLARGPRFRLPAEMVRDNALAASGLLNETIGGPSVRPYQPKGLWEEMAFGEGFSAQEFVPSKGRDLYRRSMYTFWKRSTPPPQMITFDAPDREKCASRRALTNTPLQALVLLNDPTYIEAARSLAARALHEGGAEAGAQIAYAFRLATARKPTAQETRILRELLTQERAHYRRDKKAATELLHVGDSAPDANIEPSELAAWTTVASAILNLDETITKE